MESIASYLTFDEIFTVLLKRRVSRIQWKVQWFAFFPVYTSKYLRSY